MLLFPPLPRFLTAAEKFLVPIIAVVCIVGVYSLKNRMFEVWLMIIFALLGYFLRKADFPALPLVLGVTLGPTAEAAFRKALIQSGGDYTVFFTRPLSCCMFVICIAAVVFQIVRTVKKRNAR